MRKGEQSKDEKLKGVNGRILKDGVEVRRCAENFAQVLNVEDVTDENRNDFFVFYGEFY